ncbi:enoyl-CoA hydratase/isomerase family protein [Pseudonocardia sp. KRD291]|uniref:enoyl-CoA hydratase/isomerase family protein n=1 Tax=Pseudonocardia sp. KRD291 TaxID=2792007 RepID=UPI001C4A1142|nr:enoyl-CoA hydratase/isomerase family protein [Pseudonocardia sp. KRD291]
MSVRPDAAAARTWMRSANAATLALLAIEIPLIVALNDVAAGVGFSIALTGDVRLAAEGSRMISSFANVGLVPDGGGLWLLSRMVGLHRAKEMFLFSEPLDATQASSSARVRETRPPEELLAAAMVMAHRFGGARPGRSVWARRWPTGRSAATWRFTSSWRSPTRPSRGLRRPPRGDHGIPGEAAPPRR